jgi:hypothetical protein
MGSGLGWGLMVVARHGRRLWATKCFERAGVTSVWWEIWSEAASASLLSGVLAGSRLIFDIYEVCASYLGGDVRIGMHMLGSLVSCQIFTCSF